MDVPGVSQTVQLLGSQVQATSAQVAGPLSSVPVSPAVQMPPSAQDTSIDSLFPIKDNSVPLPSTPSTSPLPLNMSPLSDGHDPLRSGDDDDFNMVEAEDMNIP